MTPSLPYEQALHALAFFVLAVVALLTDERRRIAVGVALFVAVYAVLVEIHQSYLPGGGSLLTNLAITFVGLAFGICVGLLARQRLLYDLDQEAGSGDPYYDETIRRLTTGLLLSGGDTPPKTVLVTSSVPQEGKTMLSVSLALQISRSARRCLLIDCDLRRSQVHEVLNADNSVGMYQLLSGEIGFDDAVTNDCLGGLDIITSGTGSASGNGQFELAAAKDRLPALLNSENIKRVMAEAARRYDLVIVDTPPLMPVSDTRMLWNLADLTIYVVRWGSTRRKFVDAGLKQLADDGAAHAGIVLTRADRKKLAKYGLSESGMFAKQYQQYY